MSNLGFGNPYMQQQIDDSLADTTRAFNLSTQPAFNSAMVRSGSFGNSGVQQMNSEAQRQLQTSLGRQANDMRSNNYQFGATMGENQRQFDLGFDRNVYNDAFGQNQVQYQNAMGLLGMQNSMNNQSLGLANNIQNTPLNYYKGFSQQANSIGNGYGTATGTENASGSPIMGALGGAQLGSQFAKGFGGGSSSSSGWGSGQTAFSNVDISPWTFGYGKP